MAFLVADIPEVEPGLNEHCSQAANPASAVGIIPCQVFSAGKFGVMPFPMVTPSPTEEMGPANSGLVNN